MKLKQSFLVGTTSTSPLPGIVTIHYCIQRVGVQAVVGLRTERIESLTISKCHVKSSFN